MLERDVEDEKEEDKDRNDGGQTVQGWCKSKEKPATEEKIR